MYPPTSSNTSSSLRHLVNLLKTLSFGPTKLRFVYVLSHYSFKYQNPSFYLEAFRKPPTMVVVWSFGRERGRRGREISWEREGARLLECVKHLCKFKSTRYKSKSCTLMEGIYGQVSMHAIPCLPPL